MSESFCPMSSKSMPVNVDLKSIAQDVPNVHSYSYNAGVVGWVRNINFVNHFISNFDGSLICGGLCFGNGNHTSLALVEYVAKKNCSRFSIAMLLTTLIYSRLNDYILFFLVNYIQYMLR